MTTSSNGLDTLSIRTAVLLGGITCYRASCVAEWAFLRKHSKLLLKGSAC